MHIVFVELGYPRASGIVGGAGTYVQLYARQLVKMGLQVSVLCGQMTDGTSHFKDGELNIYPIIKSGPLHYYLSKIPIIRVFAPLLKYLETGWRTHKSLIKLNRKTTIDIIEYSEGGDFWNAVFGRFSYVVHLHGSAYTFKKNAGQVIKPSDWYQRKAEHFFIKRAKIVVSPCHAMIKLVEQEMDAAIKNTEVIPYPIDEKLIKKSTKKSELPQKEKIVIFFASRNDPVKGGELLVDALKLLPSSLTNKIEVRFYGYNPRQDTANLSFLSWQSFVPKDILMAAYQDADICVIPSYFDNSPNTVYEAMGAGKIIIASAVGGIPEIIGHPKYGYLFRNKDLEDLKDKLIQAIHLVSENRHFQMAEAARNRIITLTANEANTQKRLQIIQS